MLALLAVLYAVLALTLLLAPGRLQAVSPFALPGLSGRFLGSWCAFLAVLAFFAIVRDRSDEASFARLALLLWPTAALVAAARSFDDLQPSQRGAYLALVVALAALATAVLVDRSRQLTARDRSPTG